MCISYIFLQFYKLRLKFFTHFYWISNLITIDCYCVLFVLDRNTLIDVYIVNIFPQYVVYFLLVSLITFKELMFPIFINSILSVFLMIHFFLPNEEIFTYPTLVKHCFLN